MKKSLIKNILFPVVGVSLLLAIWAIAAAVVGAEIILPSPWSALKSAVALLGEGEFWARLGGTLLRALISFAISFALAFVAALLCAVFGAEKILSPLVTISRAVPTIAVILLFVVFAGARITPIIVAALVVFPTLFSALSLTASSVEKNLLDAAKIEGAGKAALIKYVYLPTMLPTAAEGAAGGVTLSVKLVVSAEVLAQTAMSIGGLMQSAKAYLDTPRLFALAAVITLFCIGAEAVLRVPLKKLTPRA